MVRKSWWYEQYQETCSTVCSPPTVHVQSVEPRLRCRELMLCVNNPPVSNSRGTAAIINPLLEVVHFRIAPSFQSVWDDVLCYHGPLRAAHRRKPDDLRQFAWLALFSKQIWFHEATFLAQSIRTEWVCQRNAQIRTSRWSVWGRKLDNRSGVQIPVEIELLNHLHGN